MKRFAILVPLALMLAAFAGCPFLQPNVQLQKQLTLSFDTHIKAEFIAFVEADAALTPEARADWRLKAEILSATIAAPVSGIHANKKYAQAIDAASAGLLEKYKGYVTDSATLGDADKKARLLNLEWGFQAPLKAALK